MIWEGDGGEDGPLVEILIGTIEEPNGCAPECHIHHQERLSWCEADDALPRYRVWHDDDDEPYSYGPASQNSPLGGICESRNHLLKLQIHV